MKRFSLTLLLGLMLTSPAMAQEPATDALIEGAKLCTRHLPRYEREYGIPTHLLSAIASTESGRYHQGLKISVPWPWTINAEGKGYYFDSKAEAVAFAYALQRRGVTSMDVGCMQVNLYHHGHAFSSLENAFNPETNIAYAASFLRALYQENRSWKQAAGDYHSKTPQRGQEYVGVVYDKWFKIVDKLRAARIQAPDESQQAMMADNASPVPDARVTYINAGNNIASAPVMLHNTVGEAPAKAKPATPLPEQQGKKLPTFKAARMNSIQLSSKQDEGIIVVKPTIKMVDSPAPRTIQVAQAAPMQTAQLPSENMQTASLSERLGHAPNDSAVIRVNAEATSQGAKKSGPNFIFND